MLSSADRRGDADRCRTVGVSTYLTKPVRQLDLLHAITNVVCEMASGVTSNFVPGMYFNHPAFASGTYIVSVTSNSITLSSNALYTKAASFVSQETAWQTDMFADGSGTGYEQFALKPGDIYHYGIATQDTTNLEAVVVTD